MANEETLPAPAIAGPIALPPDPREAFLAGRLTEKTRCAYRQDLDAFFTFAGVRTPTDITPELVTAWRNALMDQGMAFQQ